jgi:hypothetical protein
MSVLRRSGSAARKGRKYDGQIIVLGTILVFLFVLIAAVLIDVYNLEAARNWGYTVAQDAAMAGASVGRDWNSFEATLDPLATPPTPRPDNCVEPGKIRLSAGSASSTATNIIEREMEARNIPASAYYYEIRAIEDSDGGTVANWPPGGRIGGGPGDWTAHNPAVGVYISFSVHTFFMSIVGRSTVQINVFAASEVSQPAACPTMTPEGG